MAAVAAAALTSSFARAQDETKAPIKIGLVLPFTGIFAVQAQEVVTGWELALAQRNGKIAGRPVEVIKEDYELNTSLAVQKANKLIQSDKVDVLAGIFSSSAGIALTDVAKKNKTPLVLAFAVADEITGKYCNDYVARTSFSANALQAASGKYWAATGVKRVATLAPDYSAGHGMMDNFKKAFEAGGGTVVKQEWTPFQRTKDWGSNLANIQGTDAQFIYSFYAGAEALQVVKQHAAFGLKKSLPLRGDFWVYDTALWPNFGDDAVGAQYVTIWTPLDDNPSSKAFVKAYREKFGRDPNVNAVLGFDNANAVLGTADKLAGKLSDGKTFIDTLTASKFDSPRGELTFNKSHNARVPSVFIVELVKEDGAFKEKLIAQQPEGDDLPGCELK